MILPNCFPGNLPPYDYNVSEAKQYLAAAGYPGGQGLPPLIFKTPSCDVCGSAAEIIQSNLLKVGIHTTIELVPGSQFYANLADYYTNKKHAADLGDMTFAGLFGYSPDYLAPTDYWGLFVGNQSIANNYAVYDNPIVDKAINVLSTSGDQTEVVTALTAAQKAIYDDAPYAWIATTSLPLRGQGSTVWNKNLIKNVYFDPNYSGVTDSPMFNTVTFNT